MTEEQANEIIELLVGISAQLSELAVDLANRDVSGDIDEIRRAVRRIAAK